MYSILMLLPCSIVIRNMNMLASQILSASHFTAGPIICMESSDLVTADIDLDALYQAQPLAFPAGTGGRSPYGGLLVTAFSRGVPAACRPCARKSRLPGLHLMKRAFALRFPIRWMAPVQNSLPSQICAPERASVRFPAARMAILPGRRFLHQACFPDICADDLPYLKPQLTYTFPIVLANQTMTFSFRTSTADSWSVNWRCSLLTVQQSLTLLFHRPASSWRVCILTARIGNSRPSPCSLQMAAAYLPIPVPPLFIPLTAADRLATDLL